jgi:hypothetical protein
MDGTPFSITIDIGNYNGYVMIEMLKTKFSLNAHTFTITLNSINGKLTFSCPSHAFAFLGTSTAQFLGFSQTISSASSTVTLLYPLNLIGATVIRIMCPQLVTNNRDDILSLIPVNVFAGEVINYTNPNSFKNILLNNHIQLIEISLYDQNSILLDFNNVDWNIQLVLVVNKLLSNNSQNTPEIKSLQTV